VRCRTKLRRSRTSAVDDTKSPHIRIRHNRSSSFDQQSHQNSDIIDNSLDTASIQRTDSASNESQHPSAVCEQVPQYSSSNSSGNVPSSPSLENISPSASHYFHSRATEARGTAPSGTGRSVFTRMFPSFCTRRKVADKLSVRWRILGACGVCCLTLSTLTLLLLSNPEFLLDELGSGRSGSRQSGANSDLPEWFDSRPLPHVLASYIDTHNRAVNSPRSPESRFLIHEIPSNETQVLERH
jgi:hypothetical protein